MDSISKAVRQHYSIYPYPYYPSRFKSLKDLKSIGVVKSISKKCLHVSPEIIKNKRLLDAGCGTGELSCSYAAYGAKVTAVDFTPVSLKKAKSLAKKFKLKNIKFREMNLLTPKLPKNYFDFIFSLGVLHHISNPKKAFSNLVQSLKQNGIIVIGLYPKFGSLKRRLQSLLLDFIAGKSKKKRISFSKRFFGKDYNNENWYADQFAHPHESFHTIGKVMEWLKENNLTYVGSWPSFDLCNYAGFSWWPENAQKFVQRKIIQLIWFFQCKGFMFLAAKKQAKQ